MLMMLGDAAAAGRGEAPNGKEDEDEKRFFLGVGGEKLQPS